MIRAIRSWLARLGIMVRRAPKSLATRPDLELRLGLPFVVAHHSARHRGVPFFVQVGAFDGRSGDPLHELIRLHGWQGLLIEPQKKAYESLLASYADLTQLTMRNVAVAERPGPLELFKIARRRDGLPDWVEQVASFDRGVLLAHAPVIPDVAELIEVEIVEGATFQQLLEPFDRRRIDLLQVDAEGYDDEVLRLFHQAGYAASIISFEHKHLGRQRLDACYRDLISRGFRLTQDGPDTIAYREEVEP